MLTFNDFRFKGVFGTTTRRTLQSILFEISNQFITFAIAFIQQILLLFQQFLTY